MKRIALSLVAAGIAMIATPAAAQMGPTPGQGPGGSGAEVLANPSEIGLMSTTPSRINSSRREMNRGRNTPFQAGMSARQTRIHARELVTRADLQCDVSAAKVVAFTADNTPVVEVDCGHGGMVIVDSLPIQATDCLDLTPADANPAEDRFFLTCELPGNAARVTAARQSARN